MSDDTLILRLPCPLHDRGLCRSTLLCAQLSGPVVDILLDRLDEGILVYDRYGSLLLRNAVAARLPGLGGNPHLFEVSELPGLRLRNADGNEIAAEALPLRRCLDGESFRHQRLLVDSDRGNRVAIYSLDGMAVVDAAGKVLLAILIVRDRTAFDKSEESPRESQRCAVGTVADDDVQVTDGSVTAFMGITEKHHAETLLAQREREMRMITDSVPAGVAYIDTQRSFRYMNKTAERWFHRGQADIIGKAMSEVLGQDIYRIVQDRVDSVLEGHEQVFEELVPYPDGPRWMKICYRPDSGEDGQIRGFFSMVEDISAHKRLEDELARKAIDLERVNHALERFTAVASHDLRAPMSLAATYVDIVLRSPDIGERNREFLGRVATATQRASELMQSLLDFAKAGFALRSLSWCRCEELIADVLDDLVALRSESGARIDITDLPRVWADSQLLRQVFNNLISNALKYRGPNGAHIRIEGSEQDGACLLSISDNGVGIPLEEREHVFGFRHRLASDQQGAGIGLDLCRHIIMAHGGNIWIEDSALGGISVCFSLPKPEEVGAAPIG